MSQYNVNGAILSKKDSRDYKVTRYSVATTGYPKSFQLWVPPVNDQKETGNCVAQSLRVMKSIVEYNKTGGYKDYSVGWTYGLRTSADGTGAGMMPRNALANSQKYGMVFKSVFDSNDEVPGIIQVVRDASIDLAPKALPERISEYFSLLTDDEIKKTLYQMRSPVMCVIGVYPNFNSPTNGFVTAPDQSGEISGYHATTIYGWNERGWLLQNSWGPAWGSKGRAVLSYSYPKKELWGISDFITNKMVFRYRMGDRKAYINGHAVDLQTMPFIKDGQVMFGIRTLEKMGAMVNWDNNKKEVTAIWSSDDFEKYANEIYIN